MNYFILNYFILNYFIQYLKPNFNPQYNPNPNINIPKTFETVLEMVYLSYYSNPHVQTRIGLEKTSLQPDGWDFPPFSTKILDKIKSRKPFWKNIEST